MSLVVFLLMDSTMLAIKNHEQGLGVYDVDIYGTHIFV